MLGGELARRSENLKREQRERAEAAQRKAEKQRIVQERLQKQREAHEEELRVRRIAEDAAAEEVEAATIATSNPEETSPNWQMMAALPFFNPAPLLKYIPSDYRSA